MFVRVGACCRLVLFGFIFGCPCDGIVVAAAVSAQVRTAPPLVPSHRPHEETTQSRSGRQTYVLLFVCVCVSRTRSRCRLIW